MSRSRSLGAGVQSTTLALMAAHGEIGPMPDCAIFADTGWEPAAVREHLRWLMTHNVLPFPVHVVSAGDIRADLLKAGSGERWASIPAFTRTVKRHRVEIGMIRRQCTKDYKIVPIRRKVRELVGLTRRRSPKTPVVEQWIGISLDEAIRMKPSFESWQANRWPLIEKRMTRQDCLRWLERHGYPDGEALPIAALLEVAGRIARAADLPLSVDFESGYAAAADALAANARALLECGVVGCNFEDGIIGGGIYDVAAQAARIRAIADTAAALGRRFFLNARTDLFLTSDASAHADLVEEAEARARAYADAGAKGFFAPGLAEPALIERICRASPLPVNVMVSDLDAPIAPLATLGVARISYGPSHYLAAMQHLASRARRAFRL